MAITLYTFPTPNGHKISIALELLGLPYKVETVDIKNGEQHTPEFRKVSLNGRIPAITDTEGPGTDSGEPFALFESGAILQYLAEKYDKKQKFRIPRDPWSTSRLWNGSSSKTQASDLCRARQTISDSPLLRRLNTE